MDGHERAHLIRAQLVAVRTLRDDIYIDTTRACNPDHYEALDECGSKDHNSIIGVLPSLDEHACRAFKPQVNRQFDGVARDVRHCMVKRLTPHASTLGLNAAERALRVEFTKTTDLKPYSSRSF
nr:hypothetical protein CFP56_41461 [Quercus suber]